MKNELNNKQQLVVNKLTTTLDKASREALLTMLKRPNAVRVAKLANFKISGVALNELFDTDEIYGITNAVYWYAEDLLAPAMNGIQDDKLLAQLRVG